MREIIFGSVKSAVRNLELVLVLFVSGVVLNYLRLKLSPGGLSQIIFILFFGCLVIFSFYFWSATLTALCDYKKYGKWNWKDYFLCGLKKLQAVVIWVLLFILQLMFVAYMVAALDSGIYKIAGFIVLSIISYLTSLILIAVVGRVKLKDAWTRTKIILSREIFKLAGSGAYILFVAVLTSIVISILWNNAIRLDNIIISQVLVLAAEFMRSFAAVVIMATIIGVVFSSPKIKKVDIDDKVVL